MSLEKKNVGIKIPEIANKGNSTQMETSSRNAKPRLLQKVHTGGGPEQLLGGREGAGLPLTQRLLSKHVVFT